MEPTILAYLFQDGITNGAIYALLGVALIVLFSVTRVIFIPQGDLVTIGALSLATMETGRVPSSIWLLVCLAILSLCRELWTSPSGVPRRNLIGLAARRLVMPAVTTLAVFLLVPLKLGFPVNVLLAGALTIPLGPYLYRVVFQPLADRSTLVLLIAAVGTHIAAVGTCLLVFGPDGWRSVHGLRSFDLAGVTLSGQGLLIDVAVVFLLVLLTWYFGHTRTGKALRASAVSRRGAQLVGISPSSSARTSFAIAASVAFASAMLLAPVTTIYYDSGFLIGLKGFTAAVIAGLSSFPLVVVAALSLGVLEAFCAFWISPFKEVVVFASVLPILLMRSLRNRILGED